MPHDGIWHFTLTDRYYLANEQFTLNVERNRHTDLDAILTASEQWATTMHEALQLTDAIRDHIETLYLP